MEELIKIFRDKVLLPWRTYTALTVIFIIIVQVMFQNKDMSFVATLIGIYLICFLSATLPMLTGLGTRRFRRYVEALSEEEQRALVEQYHLSDHYFQATLTDQCIIIIGSRTMDIVAYEDIVWIYSIGAMSPMFGKRKQPIYLVTKDKRDHEIIMRGPDLEHIQQFIDQILRHNPAMHIGYDRKTARLFRRDFTEFLESAQRKGKTMRPAPEPEESEEPAEPEAPQELEEPADTQEPSES